MEVQPYLDFEGRCEEALEFYKKAVGAKVEMMMRMNESPEPPPPGTHPAGSENKIMHAAFRVGETQLLATDGYAKGKSNFQGVSLSISVASDAEADRVFNALAEGGKVNLPLAKTFFSSRFGMLQDRFGLGWMVIAPGPR
jgi:PhnB protein